MGVGGKQGIILGFLMWKRIVNGLLKLRQNSFRNSNK